MTDNDTARKGFETFLIVPSERCIKTVHYDGDFRSIYKLVGCETFEAPSFDRHSMDSVYIDEEGKLPHRRQPHFFTINGGPDVMAGNGLVLGCDAEGESVAPKITMIRLLCNVTYFTLGPVPYIGMRTSALDPAHGSPADIRKLDIAAELV